MPARASAVALAIRGARRPQRARRFHGLCLAGFLSRSSYLTGRTWLRRRMQEVWKAREKFCESQQPRIDALWRFVQEQRARRRQARPTAPQPSSSETLVGGHALIDNSRQTFLLKVMLCCHA